MKEYHVGDMVWVARPTPFFGVSRLRVDKVRITETSSERTVEYETNAYPSGCGNEFIPLDNDRIFDTKEEVFAKAETCGGGGVREIKFRGKSEETGAWVYGSLVGGHQPYILGEIIEADPEYIIPEFWEPVDPETIGQYTGFHDKNDVEIYEDDVAEDNEGQGKITWVQEHCAFLVATAGGFFTLENGDADYKLKETRVIGNVHDNPEMEVS